MSYTNKLLALICHIFILSACTTIGEVDLQNLPKLEGTGKALISGYFEDSHALLIGFDQQIVFTSLDEKSLFRLGLKSDYPHSLLVTPGRHSIRVKYMYSGRYAYLDLNFKAESERSYLVKNRIEGRTIFVWVEDSVTGHRVSGSLGEEPSVNPVK